MNFLVSLACAACYGQSDSPLAAGMNWAIMSLLGVIGLVLCGVTTFFVYLVKKSTPGAAAALTAHPDAPPATPVYWPLVTNTNASAESSPPPASHLPLLP